MTLTVSVTETTDGRLAHFAGIVAAVTDAILSVDENENLILFNPAAERMFGRTQAAVLGESLDILLASPSRAIVRDFISALSNTDEVARPILDERELKGLRADGSEFPIEVSISQVVVGDRKIVTTVLRDVSERKQNEQALRERAEYLRILNSIHQSVLSASSSEAIAQIVLSRISELLPYPQSSILLSDTRERELIVLATNMRSFTHLQPRMAFPLRDFVQPWGKASSFLTGNVEIIPDTRNVPTPPAMQQLLFSEGIRAVLDIPLVVAGKRIGVLNLFDTTPRTPTNNEIESARHVADILAVALHQARLHQFVDTTRERLQALSHRQLDAGEVERRRLARDLHDMVGQNLTALNINLHAIGRKLPPETDPAVRTRLEDSSRLVEEIVGRIRNLMAELRPSILDDLGLPTALRWYTGEFSNRTELAGQAVVEEILPRLPQDVETALFRIAQEALTNIAKHAHAGEALVQLRTVGDMVEMTISDDGTGFDFAAMRRDPSKRGVGLVDMRERAEAIGGRIWVECEPGMGTQVKVQVPR